MNKSARMKRQHLKHWQERHAYRSLPFRVLHFTGQGYIEPAVTGTMVLQATPGDDVPTIVDVEPADSTAVPVVNTYTRAHAFNEGYSKLGWPPPVMLVGTVVFLPEPE